MDSSINKDKLDYSTIIVIMPKDFPRLVKHYKRLVANIPSERLLFVSGDCIEDELKKADLGENVGFIHENELLTFESVRDCMAAHLRPLLGSEPVLRGAVGWYYQQFLKMEYSRICEDEYYLVWDGDTIPCAPFSMFQEETGLPYLDVKQEYHALYFETLEKILPGMRKVIGKSFISEHMLFNKGIMQELIAKIEENDAVPGATYWEKIIHSIRPEQIYDSGFSEFETYGTYVAFTDPSHYKLREWHSFRLGAEFFDPDTICDRDFEWLAKDFQAISFEKNQSVREDNRNLFDNPEYQKKLSARKMLEVAQEEFNGGYIEVWGDTNGRIGLDPMATGDERSSNKLSEDVILAALAEKRIGAGNVNQAYLCYEQAAFLTEDAELKANYKNKLEQLRQAPGFSVHPVSICIVSYNSRTYMEECIRSIKFTCAPGAYEIVVTDNASTDSVRDYLLEISDDMTLVLCDENLGFPAGCNCCIQYSAPDNDIFLLNNDTRMTRNALFWLRYALYESSDVGAAGCMGSYAGNEQMVALKTENVMDIVDFAERSNVYMDNPCEEKCRLCGFAMLIKRSVIKEIGGLDEAFSPGYFEDDDLSVRINEAGYRQMVVHNSFIYHKGSVNFNKKAQYEINENLERNHRYSIEKNGYDNLIAAIILKSELSTINIIRAERKKDFSLLEINCGSGNFLSHVKYLFPEAYVCGTSAIQLEIEHGVKNIPMSVYDPSDDSADLGAILTDMTNDGQNQFDYVLVRIIDYGTGAENSPGFISPEDAKAKFAGLVRQGGKLLYMTENE